MTDEQSDLVRRPYWHYIKKHKTTVALGLLWLFLTNLMDVLIPRLIQITIDRISAGATLRHVAEVVGWILLVTVFLSVFRFLWRVYWATFHHTVAEDLRNRVFARMADLGPTFFRPRKIGQLITLISNDVNSFRMGIGPGLLILFDGIILVALILPQMIWISWTWTWQTLALMPFVPFLVKWILDRLHVAYHERQERFSVQSGAAQEIVSGIRVIKGFAQESNQTSQFNVHSAGFTRACDRVAYWDALFGPALELPVALGSALLLLLGAPAVIRGEISLGQFFAFYLYIQRMIWPMSAIGIAMGHVQESRASFRRIREVLEYPRDVEDAGDLEFEELQSLEVRGLSFRYPEASAPSLVNVSFKLERGQCLGIVGLTGAGKSTLVELLTRQYPVPAGTILINGVSVERIRLGCLRRLIGVVPQEAFLFSRQVQENLALGLEIWDLDDVRAAAGQVRLDREIESWPGRYEALVGERGVNLSGGQKQRMTLARALARQAPLLILDDALSAVDAKTEKVILSALREEVRKTTSIVVSHRLASLRLADQILVLHNGTVEALGRHEDLLISSPTYQRLNQMQIMRATQMEDSP
ncbi:MAG: ABC transporter ATP-binding protein [Bdellovibrionales bacterium]